MCVAVNVLSVLLRKTVTLSSNQRSKLVLIHGQEKLGDIILEVKPNFEHLNLMNNIKNLEKSRNSN